MDYPFCQGDTVQDAFRKVLTADIPVLGISDDMKVEPGAESVFQEMAFTKFWSHRIENRPRIVFPIRGGYTKEQVNLTLRALTKENIDSVAAMVTSVLNRKRLFVSSRGYIGWGPEAMIPGDVITVLNGCSMPFVLRAVPQHLSRTGFSSGYTVVGECYAHGLMNGEALENAEMDKRGILLY